MNAKFWQRGEVLDYKAADAALENGQVVDLGTRIGVVGGHIAQGDTGPLHVAGVFEMEKAADAVAMGAALYYDKTAGKLTTAATSGGGNNTPAGYAAAGAESGDATVLVKLPG